MPIDPLIKDRWLREFRPNGFVILRGVLPRAMFDQTDRVAKAGTT